ncbi:peptidoglycan D,D-transpeptidase FtsI family protein [Lacticaseibacillus yichunensis]|uniref:Peptidoglycan D,D-transpeptidase FtsI family protein n=1 Tax=Lacticaseibacillus yichunensis TaxID=2486015 RepID=A0ABW4CQS3_9LACO|nr:penicillin-binding protein 2 [Lacticaseibacillus yichunensis]
MKYIRTQKPKRVKSQIPLRLNLLFFFVFLLLAALVAQLAYLQIFNGEKFRTEVDRTDQTLVTGAVPRGLIFDSQGRPLVTNQANNAITYTKSMGVTAASMRAVADKLVTYITVDTDNLQPRDYADYYLSDSDASDAVIQKIPDAATKYKNDTGKLYTAQTEYVEKHMPNFTAKQKQSVALYKIMNGATSLTTVYLKNTGLTEKELALVGEHLTEMPGVNLGTDWERHYPNGASMTSIIGTVSSEKSGLPSDGLTGYLANGYARNDRVGISYLEKAYENVLKGAKSRTQVEIGSDNEIINSVQKFKGQQGANLTLTIDSAYQQKVEAILKKTFASAVSDGEAANADGAYAVAMNPSTGAVLAIAGEAQNTKSHKVSDDALGVLNRAFAMGSAVKPAMILGALQDGVITTSENTIADTPIYLPATPVKKSVYPVGTFSSLNAASALEVSSNIYMMHLAMREANAKYTPKVSMTMDSDIFDKMRRYFAEFGLGLTTGIDLPGEISGLQGATTLNGQLAVGSALDLSYGNYDTYTLMQMAQYVSAVANNGYRMKPYIVQSISQTANNGKATATTNVTTPTILGKIPNTQAQIDLVKQGMWQVVHGTNGWTTATSLNTLNPGVAGKTGTAQTFTRADPEDNTSKLLETTTLSFVGFAPATDPQIAIAVVFPNLEADTDGNYAQVVAKQMFSDYYKMNDVKEDKNYTPHQVKLKN